MRVADFFCGAGGFSEGFRQAGFDICFAVDRWEPALTTYKANKPNCLTLKEDIVHLSNLPDDAFHEKVPDTEVIIGSPPCIAFSNSNKSGKGDKKKGLILLKAYLRIVARKRFKPNSQLRYWVLENVPNIKKYMQKEYTANDLGLSGDFILHVINDNSGIFNAKYFGAPTNRKRFFCGEFPTPEQTNTDETALKLRTVLDSLGYPQSAETTNVTDCCYPELIMARDEVTDHHYIPRLQPFEWETAKRLKEDKGYMGRMSFPENLDNPSRTVMATMSSSSRESMILPTTDGGFRLPTVREAATMMSFPIDYRFYGLSRGTKHTLVGNAVPPKMSYAIAKAIACDAGEELPNNYIPIQHDCRYEFHNLNNIVIEPKLEKEKREIAKFKYHIPYLILAAYRVELTNYHSDFESKNFIWSAEIHHSQGKKKAAVYKPDINDNELPNDLYVYTQSYLQEIMPKIIKPLQFQRAFCMTKTQRLENNLWGPYEILNSVKTFIGNAISENQWTVGCKICDSPILLPTPIMLGYYTLTRITNIMEEVE